MESATITIRKVATKNKSKVIHDPVIRIFGNHIYIYIYIYKTNICAVMYNITLVHKV